jgi:serine/threonine protein phosphatase 1
MARYVIGDIHGCSKTLNALLFEQIKITKNDQVYFLGDLVNKGPDSKGVLDLIFFLIDEGYFIRGVRGNHDEMFLNASKGRMSHFWLTEYGSSKTVSSFETEDIEKIPLKYFDFISGLPLYIELDNAFIVHAGFNFSVKDPLSDTGRMMFIRNFTYDAEKLKGKRLIHGHHPLLLGTITTRLNLDPSCVNLDAGCVYYRNEGHGYLLALDLDTNRLFIQENIDKPYKIDLR